MKTIHKYHLDMTDNQYVRLPQGAEILTVQVQHSRPQLWAQVDDDNSAEGGYEQWIYMRGTGHAMAQADGARYLSTLQFNDGALVLHVFAKI